MIHDNRGDMLATPIWILDHRSQPDPGSNPNHSAHFEFILSRETSSFLFCNQSWLTFLFRTCPSSWNSRDLFSKALSLDGGNVCSRRPHSESPVSIQVITIRCLLVSSKAKQREFFSAFVSAIILVHFRMAFVSNEWKPTEIDAQEYIEQAVQHEAGVMTGKSWMEKLIEFQHLRLTNCEDRRSASTVSLSHLHS